MKKFLFAFLLTMGLFRFGHAAITDEGVTREKTTTIYFSTTVPLNTNPARFVLIQLSSTSYPHLTLNPSDTGEIDVSHIRADIDKVAASSGSVRIGVVTFVNTSTGSVTWFWKRSFTKNVSNTDLSYTENDTPAFYRCKVRPPASPSTQVIGITPWIVSNETSNTNNVYVSTGVFSSPIGSTSFLKAGDIVMEIVNFDFTNAIIVNVSLLYHAEP